MLVADRLGAGVELVEVLVGGLGDHDRALRRLAVGVRGVERVVLGALLVGVEVDAVRGRRSRGARVRLAVAERVLGRAGRRGLGRVSCGSARRARRRVGWRVRCGPEAAGADGLVLLRVADRDQPRAGRFDRASSWMLFAGGRERGLVMDHRARGRQRHRAGRGSRRGARRWSTRWRSRRRSASSVARRSAASAAVLVTMICRPLAWWARAIAGQRRALPGPGLPLDHHQPPVAARELDRRALLVDNRPPRVRELAVEPLGLALDDRSPGCGATRRGGEPPGDRDGRRSRAAVLAGGAGPVGEQQNLAGRSERA